ncbi:lipase family protein [Paenibacillus gansuensis]|uniref:Lipase family protein n=1 Tax=Paenibacillus gansuensis TaxID=306542 RepID=A0ABW5PGU7_9BACL
MDLKALPVRRALFLAGVCKQASLQYEKRGKYMLAGYREAGSIRTSGVYGQGVLYGFIWESDREIIVAFRGTESIQDWVYDSMAVQQPFPYLADGGWTHKGFTRIYASARESLMKVLERLSARKRIWITGYSMGGALATLCALDVAAHTKHKHPKLYTFGSPRVGNPEFVNAFNQRIKVSRRMANSSDPVTKLPPRYYESISAGRAYIYEHVKGLIPVSFRKGLSLNHALSHYFEVLRNEVPDYADELCRSNPGFCP